MKLKYQKCASFLDHPVYITLASVSLLGSHTNSIRTLWNDRSSRLSVPRQNSKTKRDRREISSPL